MESDATSFPALTSMRASCIADDKRCSARTYSTSCSNWQRLLLRKHAWSTVNAIDGSDWSASCATDGSGWTTLSLAISVADMADSDWIRRRDSARSRTQRTRLRTNWSLHRVVSSTSAYTSTCIDIKTHTNMDWLRERHLHLHTYTQVFKVVIHHNCPICSDAKLSWERFNIPLHALYVIEVMIS